MGKRYLLVEQKSWRSEILLTTLKFFFDDLHTIAIMLLSGRVLYSSTETDSSFMQKNQFIRIWDGSQNLKKNAKKANSTGTDVGDDKNIGQLLWGIIIWTQLC